MKTRTYSKLAKKLDGGGMLNNGLTSAGLGSVAGDALGIAQNVFQARNNQRNLGSDLANTGKDTLLGAEAGTEILPGIGTIIGGGIGALAGGIKTIYDIPQFKANKINQQITLNAQNRGAVESAPNLGQSSLPYADGGGIHIKKSHEGLFTKKAKAAGMGVQEFAKHVMSNKSKYSSSTVKQANFAKNASKFKHADGGNLIDKKLNGDLINYNGPSHEDGGIPIENNGLPTNDQTQNEVEGGESMLDNYVFSDRLGVDRDGIPTIDEKEVAKKGNSFADLAKKIDNKYKDRDDKVAQDSKDREYQRLQEQNELAKQEKEGIEDDKFQKDFGKFQQKYGGKLNQFLNGGLMVAETPFMERQLALGDFIIPGANAPIGLNANSNYGQGITSSVLGIDPLSTNSNFTGQDDILSNNTLPNIPGTTARQVVNSTPTFGSKLETAIGGLNTQQNRLGLLASAAPTLQFAESFKKDKNILEHNPNDSTVNGLLSELPTKYNVSADINDQQREYAATLANNRQGSRGVANAFSSNALGTVGNTINKINQEKFNKETELQSNKLEKMAGALQEQGKFSAEAQHQLNVENNQDAAKRRDLRANALANFSKIEGENAQQTNSYKLAAQIESAYNFDPKHPYDAVTVKSWTPERQAAYRQYIALKLGQASNTDDYDLMTSDKQYDKYADMDQDTYKAIGKKNGW